MYKATMNLSKKKKKKSRKVFLRLLPTKLWIIFASQDLSAA